LGKNALGKNALGKNALGKRNAKLCKNIVVQKKGIKPNNCKSKSMNVLFDLKKSIPWIEKYRPSQFDEIVLDPINRQLFLNIIEYDSFPNLLLYGPPGSGKTSTIINLINEYQQKHNRNYVANKGNVIHLNASDERGIDIIRNQIYQFVSSKNLFDQGIKFVVLDEVDYMTKNAQQALKYLLQTTSLNVRFCLICNYVSKIDESLKNEFICVRFNQLPKHEIIRFIQSISQKENIHLTVSTIEKIQSVYQSDIRSMINFIQSNYVSSTIESSSSLECIVHSQLWENIHTCLCHDTCDSNAVIQLMDAISCQYNIDKKQIIQNYFNHVVRHYSVTREFLNIVEMIVHNNENVPTSTTVDFFIYSLKGSP
jgi:replication factor C subunit 3/5